ncbi:hypothetical protein IF1G_06270 [Cordyceps javanica]|uniref:Uncharacterized protein n=1 Tax=Cordyceps javanica TaxID=43265 RepID=A0A545V0Q3_9HYPO|nr:hypothetical protein IF1G_06270 [Cordyceps javanica]
MAVCYCRFLIAKCYIQWLATAENSAVFHRMLHRKIDSLHELFAIQFDNILQQIPEKKCLAKTLFTRIIKHNGSLTLDELREALSDEITQVAISQGQGRDLSDGELIEIVKSCCKGFVCVSERESPMRRIRFTHSSIAEFLTAAGQVPVSFSSAAPVKLAT